MAASRALSEFMSWVSCFASVPFQIKEYISRNTYGCVNPWFHMLYTIYRLYLKWGIQHDPILPSHTTCQHDAPKFLTIAAHVLVPPSPCEHKMRRRTSAHVGMFIQNLALILITVQWWECWYRNKIWSVCEGFSSDTCGVCVCVCAPL